MEPTSALAAKFAGGGKTRFSSSVDSMFSDMSGCLLVCLELLLQTGIAWAKTIACPCSSAIVCDTRVTACRFLCRLSISAERTFAIVRRIRLIVEVALELRSWGVIAY